MNCYIPGTHLPGYFRFVPAGTHSLISFDLLVLSVSSMLSVVSFFFFSVCSVFSGKDVSRLLQLRVFLHQLLQSESRELYRNLDVFSFAFTLVHCSFHILRMI